MAQRFGQFFLEPQWPSYDDENNFGLANLDAYSDQCPAICKLQECQPLDVIIKVQEPEELMKVAFDPLIIKQEESDDYNSSYDEDSYDDYTYSKNCQVKQQTIVKIQHRDDDDNDDDEWEVDSRPIERKGIRTKQISHTSIPKKQKTRAIRKKKRGEYERGRYQILSEQLKKQIVDQSRTMTMVEVSKKYHVSVNNICRWRKRCDRRSGAGRKVTDMEMEKRLLDWLLKQRNPIARKQVQSRARKMSRQEGFKASKGWFERFYKRNKLYCNENVEILTHNNYRLRLKSRIEQESKNESAPQIIKREQDEDYSMLSQE